MLSVLNRGGGGKIDPKLFGFTKAVVSEFTPTSTINIGGWDASSYPVPHALGEIPRFAIFYEPEISGQSGSVLHGAAFTRKGTTSTYVGAHVYTNGSITSWISPGSSVYQLCAATTTTFTINVGIYNGIPMYLYAGHTYRLVLMA